MADEMSRTNGLFIPYPLLGLMLTLVLALGGGLIGIYAQVSSMNATMLMRDSDSREQIKALHEDAKLQAMYIADLREKIIRLEERKKGNN
jgi:hypothetical protein